VGPWDVGDWHFASKAINRDRTSYSFKTVSCAHIASAFNFEIEIKNIILVALRIFEFSHSLGHSRSVRANARSNHVRHTPIATGSSGAFKMT